MCHNLLLLDHLLNFALRQIGNLSCSSGSCWRFTVLGLATRSCAVHLCACVHLGGTGNRLNKLQRSERASEYKNYLSAKWLLIASCLKT